MRPAIGEARIDLGGIDPVAWLWHGVGIGVLGIIQRAGRRAGVVVAGEAMIILVHQLGLEQRQPALCASHQPTIGARLRPGRQQPGPRAE